MHEYCSPFGCVQIGPGGRLSLAPMHESEFVGFDQLIDMSAAFEGVPLVAAGHLYGDKWIALVDAAGTHLTALTVDPPLDRDEYGDYERELEVDPMEDPELGAAVLATFGEEAGDPEWITEYLCGLSVLDRAAWDRLVAILRERAPQARLWCYDAVGGIVSRMLVFDGERTRELPLVPQDTEVWDAIAKATGRDDPCTLYHDVVHGQVELAPGLHEPKPLSVRLPTEVRLSLERAASTTGVSPERHATELLRQHATRFRGPAPGPASTPPMQLRVGIDTWLELSEMADAVDERPSVIAAAVLASVLGH